MENFGIRDYKFIYSDDESEEILLDLLDPLSNKGRIPFNSGLTSITIPNLITFNMENHEKYCGDNIGLIQYEPYFVLMDVLLIKEHIKNKFPKTIVEYGNNDVLAAHYENILRHLHPETRYIFRKCDDSLETYDKVYADMIFINGTDIIPNFDHIIDATRKAVHKGIFICAFVIGQKELRDTIHHAFRGGRTYKLNDTAEIYATLCSEE